MPGFFLRPFSATASGHTSDVSSHRPERLSGHIIIPIYVSLTLEPPLWPIPTL